MEFQAVIKEDYRNNPSIKLSDDGTDITFHCYSEDVNKLKQLWREQTVFLISEEK
jgi:Tat protein secretion system quality control protein TatD with DNase activity